MNQKIQNGAIGIISQPVFDIENAKKLLESFNISKQDVEGDKQKLNLFLDYFQ